MKFECVFNHVKKSDKLKEYASSKLEKLHKFELKPFSTQVIFGEVKSNKTQKMAEVIINMKQKRYVAKGYGENLYQALDQATHRMAKQLQKSKEKARNHKHSQHSDEHSLDCLNSRLEFDYSRIKGAAKQKAA